MKIFIINLKRAKVRRKRIEQHIQDLDLSNVEFIEAVDGKKMNDAEFNALHNKKWADKWVKRPMAKTEIGCTLSHLKCYQRIIDDNLPGAIILEDDTILAKDAKALINQLAKSDCPNNGVVLFHYVKHISRKPLFSLNEQHHVHKAWREMCAHAYYISHTAAKSLLAFQTPIKTPMDFWQHYIDQEVLSLYAIIPPIADTIANNKKTSSINKERDSLIYFSWRQKLTRTIKNHNPLRKYFSILKCALKGQKIQ